MYKYLVSTEWLNISTFVIELIFDIFISIVTFLDLNLFLNLVWDGEYQCERIIQKSKTKK